MTQRPETLTVLDFSSLVQVIGPLRLHITWNTLSPAQPVTSHDGSVA